MERYSRSILSDLYNVDVCDCTGASRNPSQFNSVFIQFLKFSKTLHEENSGHDQIKEFS